MRTNTTSTLTEEQKMRSEDRAYVVVSLCLFFTFCIIVKAFYIQVLQHNHYISLGNNQYTSSVPINFDRGTIFFSHYGSTPVPAAQLRANYRIAIDPTQIKDAEDLYVKLTKYITLDKILFLEKAHKKNDPYEEIVKDVRDDTVTLLKAQNLKGVSYYRDNERSYPQESVGAKVIGFVGNNGSSVRGQYGLERYYEDVLTRDSKDNTINFLQNFLLILKKQWFQIQIVRKVTFFLL